MCPGLGRVGGVHPPGYNRSCRACGSTWLDDDDLDDDDLDDDDLDDDDLDDDLDDDEVDL
jgi:hypothetical protein